MPYPATHKPQTRERILNSAAQLFTKNGYEGVSIDQVMAEAGLTRGAFYSHFADKSSLYAAAIQYASKERFRFYRAELTAGVSIERLIEGYLHPDHIKGRDMPCALAFLVSDISQREQQVRSTYTEVYKGLLQGLEHLGTDEKRERLACIAASVLMIGGVAIGRALDDEQITSDLLEACRAVSLQLLEPDQTL
ncbi:MAG: TetR/AcrR family transcriptional regulator [Thiothrix sp.]|nr:MAG: TetR/AcrR family transcriptional regulator [Thiothrix sp.]